MTTLITLALMSVLSQPAPPAIPIAPTASCVSATFQVSDMGDGQAQVDAIASWTCRFPRAGTVRLSIDGVVVAATTLRRSPVPLRAVVPADLLPAQACVEIKTDRGEIHSRCEEVGFPSPSAPLPGGLLQDGGDRF